MDGCTFGLSAAVAEPKGRESDQETALHGRRREETAALQLACLTRETRGGAEAERRGNNSTF